MMKIGILGGGNPLALLWVWQAYPGGMGREFAFSIVKR